MAGSQGRDDGWAPLLVLSGGGEDSLAALEEEAADALERLAVRLPASDVLAAPAAALAGCLHRRLQSHQRQQAGP